MGKRKEVSIQEIDAIDQSEAKQNSAELVTMKSVKVRKWTRKKLIILVTLLLLVIGVIAAVPFLRYGVMGLVVHKQVLLTVIDAGNNKPVSGAVVKLGRSNATSDSKGRVSFDGVAVGDYTLTVEKKYYATDTSDFRVPIFTASANSVRNLRATGRTVSVTVTNMISGKPVVGAAVNIQDSTAISDDKGTASVILPVKADVQEGTIKADGYNNAVIGVMVKTNDDQQITKTLTPSGTVYFLSKRTGVINVMSSKLDGSGQEVVVQGTGSEDDNNTTLLSSQSWKYLALLANRDKDYQKTYMINADTGKLTTVDDRKGSTIPVGWVGNTFYYQFAKDGGLVWQNGLQELVSYNAESGQRQTVDSTVGTGDSYYNYAGENMSTVSIVGSSLIYAKNWSYSSYYGDKSSPIVITKVDGGIKSTLLQIAATDTTYVSAVLLRPGDIGFGIGSMGSADVAYYEYASGKVAKTTALSSSDLYSRRLSYLISPDGDRVFWTEGRDGRNVLLTSDLTLANPTTMNTGDYAAYGWYGNDYVLYSKNQSELYIATARQPFGGEHKITDFHKGSQMYPGYGYGYGGAF